MSKNYSGFTGILWIFGKRSSCHLHRYWKQNRFSILCTNFKLSSQSYRVLMAQFVSWVVMVLLMDEWKCVWLGHGELCVLAV